MTESQYVSAKESYIKLLKDMLTDTGSVLPCITIFGELKDEEQKNESDKKPAIIGIPLSPDFLNSDETKDVFLDVILPDIYKNVKEKFNTCAVAYASEAWMTVVSLKDDKEPIQKEVLIVSIDSKFFSQEQYVIYEIKRTGKKVNSDGNLIDSIELEIFEENAPGKVQGRFTNLFKKLENTL